MKLARLVAGALSAAAMMCGAAQAAWPEKPIEVIIAYAAGGATDVAARAILPFMKKHLPPNLSFVVVNKPGAGGEIGTTEIATAKPDGYTIGFLNSPSFLQKPYERKIRYSKDSFTYIANIVYDPGMFAVLADSEFKTLKDLVDFAKKNPRAVTVATAGIGTDDHLNLTRFQGLSGTQLTMVPFAGDQPAMTAMLGGHTKMASMNIGAFGSWLQEGKLRGLAIASEVPDPLAPTVPTFRDQGYDLIGGSARGMGGPAGMPAEAVQQLSQALAKAITDPEFVELSRKQYVVLKYMDSAAYRKFIDEQDAMVKEQWEKDPWVKK